MFSGLGQPPRLSFPAFLWQAPLSSPAACQPQLMQLPPPTPLQGPACCAGWGGGSISLHPPPGCCWWRGSASTHLSPTFLFKKLTPLCLRVSITPMYLSPCMGKRLPRQHETSLSLSHSSPSPLSLSVSTWEYLCLQVCGMCFRSPCLSLSPFCAALSSLSPSSL